MLNFKENINPASIEPTKDNFTENFTKERLEGILDSVTVGDIKIKPWKINGLHLKTPNPDVFSGKEINNPRERNLLTEEAIIAAQEILNAYFLPNQTGFNEDLAGLCGRGAAIVQELLAHVNVRSIQVYGQYHAQKTERHLNRPDYSFLPPELDFHAKGDYEHAWLYESLAGIIPVSTEHAREDIVIVDPTRCQFHRQKPMIVHPDESKYELLPIPKSRKDDFYQANGWLWNDEELEQWKNILNSLIK